MTQRRIKALVKLDEPGTRIRRMLDAPLRVYPDGDAGYGQRYVLQIGTLSIAADWSDLAHLTDEIREQLRIPEARAEVETMLAVRRAEKKAEPTAAVSVAETVSGGESA